MTQDVAAETGQPTRTGAAAGVWTLRAGVTVLAASVLLQAITAGEFLGGDASWLSAHGTGSTAVHGSSLIAVLGAILIWRPARGPAWPAHVNVVLFVLTFVQSAVGGSGNLAMHVPLAIVLTLLTGWILVWAWAPQRLVWAAGRS